MANPRNINIIAILILLFFIIIAALVTVVFGELILLYWWVIAFLVFSLLMLLFERRYEGRSDIFSPVTVFIFITFIFFIFPAIYFVDKTEKSFMLSELCVILSMPCFFFGYFLSRIKVFSRIALASPKEEWSPAIARFFCLSLMPFSIAMFFLIVQPFGGIWGYLANLWTNSRVTLGGMAYIVEIMTLPLMTTYFVMADYFKAGRKIDIILGIFSLSLYSTLSLFITAERGSIIIPIFSFLIMRHYLKRRYGILHICGMALIVLFALVTLGILRDYLHFGGTLGSDMINNLLSADFPGYMLMHTGGMIFDVYQNTIASVPSVINYQYGFTYLVFAVKFVPRIFMPDKIQGASEIIMAALYPQVKDAFFTPSYLGELYLNFGLAGVLTGSLLLGVFAAWLYSFLQKNIKNRLAVILYSVMMPIFIFEMRGDFGNATVGLIMGPVKIMLIYFLLKIFTVKKQGDLFLL